MTNSDQDTDASTDEKYTAEDMKERFGTLIADDTAEELAEKMNEEEQKPDTHPQCELCGNAPATKYGVLCVNARAFPNTPLCDDCFIPFEDIGLPRDVPREEFAEMHEDRDIDQEV